jgi:hypothetical protein
MYKDVAKLDSNSKSALNSGYINYSFAKYLPSNSTESNLE